MNYLTKRQSYWIIGLIPALAILLGGFIYVFLRPVEPLFMNWARMTGLNAFINLIRPDPTASITAFPDWIVYSLPGALWAFAYALFIIRIWADSGHWIRYFWLSTIPILVIGFEILQYPGIIPGTFTAHDLLASILGSLAGVTFGIKSKKISNHENNIH